MEEVFVPHWQKLWASWKGRHWSIMSISGMHASDWKDEGPSVNPLGEDGVGESFRRGWSIAQFIAVERLPITEFIPAER